MLRLLLDEHISPRVSEGLLRRNRALVVHYLAEWEGGSLLGRFDSRAVRFRLPASGGPARPDAGQLRSPDDPDAAERLGGSRPRSRRRDFHRRKNHTTRRYGQLGASLGQARQSGSELGLDESNSFPALLIHPAAGRCCGCPRHGIPDRSPEHPFINPPNRI